MHRYEQAVWGAMPHTMVAQAVCAFHGGKAKRALANAQRAVEAADLRVRGLRLRANEKPIC